MPETPRYRPYRSNHDGSASHGPLFSEGTTLEEAQALALHPRYSLFAKCIEVHEVEERGQGERGRVERVIVQRWRYDGTAWAPHSELPGLRQQLLHYEKLHQTLQKNLATAERLMAQLERAGLREAERDPRPPQNVDDLRWLWCRPNWRVEVELEDGRAHWSAHIEYTLATVRDGGYGPTTGDPLPEEVVEYIRGTLRKL